MIHSVIWNVRGTVDCLQYKGSVEVVYMPKLAILWLVWLLCIVENDKSGTCNSLWRRFGVLDMFFVAVAPFSIDWIDEARDSRVYATSCN